jgi:hypothetical protein
LTAASPSEGKRTPDLALLSAPASPLLDPGQPVRQLDPRHPQVRAREQDRARSYPYLRQLPQADRVPLHSDQPIRLRQRRLPRLGGRQLATANCGEIFAAGRRADSAFAPRSTAKNDGVPTTCAHIALRVTARPGAAAALCRLHRMVLDHDGLRWCLPAVSRLPQPGEAREGKRSRGPTKMGAFLTGRGLDCRPAHQKTRGSFSTELDRSREPLLAMPDTASPAGSIRMCNGNRCGVRRGASELDPIAAGRNCRRRRRVSLYRYVPRQERYGASRLRAVRDRAAAPRAGSFPCGKAGWRCACAAIAEHTR